MMEQSLPQSQQDLEESKIESQTKNTSITAYLKTNVHIRHADIPIIACCFVSGLCDSSVYASWQCFVSMQTGNTIFLALGTSNQPIDHPWGWLKSLISILFFVFGCFFFAQTRHFRPLSRGTLTGSFALQALLVFIAAGLVQAGVVPPSNGASVGGSGGQSHFMEMLPLAFLAFQSGAQIITSRLLGFNEVPTTVLTSVYCDLISDTQLLAPLNKNVKRNRRFSAVVTLLVGAIIGGWMVRSSPGLAGVLWIGGGVKVGIAIGWILWKGEQIA